MSEPRFKLSRPEHSCCHVASVIDTQNADAMIAECPDEDTAQRIRDMLNAANLPRAEG